MFDDAKQLWAEFDIGVITNPQGPEQFAFSLIMIAILGVCGFIVLRLLLDLLK
jgi:hypothetical protein